MRTFVVVGAGILGSSTAYHLAKAGAKVTLVDRNDLGQATKAAAGMICPWISQRRNKAWYTLAKNGAKYYPDLIKQLEREGEKDTGYKRVGALSVHSNIEKLNKTEERANKRLNGAPEMGEITRLSETETQQKFPLLKEELSALYVSGAARVNGELLCDALIRAAKRNGATFIEGDAQIAYDDKRVTGVIVEENKILADKVIVTAGAWAKELLAPLGIQLLIEPQKAQIVHLKLSDEHTDHWPVVMAPTNQYMLAFEGGRMVVGTTYEDGVGFNYAVTAGGLHEILGKAFEIAPTLVNSTVLETKVGFRPVAPGFHPVVGEIPNYKGILLANGLGSSGLTVGPYLGSEIAKLALGEAVELDLEQYEVSRAIK